MIAAVLAGGESRRMGRPKAELELGGRTLLACAVDAARAAGLRPVVIAKAGMRLPYVDAERWDEPPEPRHPLTGIVAALERAGAEGVVALACDTPLVPPALLSALAGGAARLTQVCTPDGRRHPLPGRYVLTPELRTALADLAPLAAMAADLLDWPDARALLNVNSPEDLSLARTRT